MAESDYEPTWTDPVVGSFRRKWRCRRDGCGREVVDKRGHDLWHSKRNLDLTTNAVDPADVRAVAAAESFRLARKYDRERLRAIRKAMGR